jgi:hypothetical protein
LPTCTPLFIVAIRSSTLAILVIVIGLGKLTKGGPNASAPANENMMQVEEEQQLTECNVYVRNVISFEVETKGGVRLFGINGPEDPWREDDGGRISTRTIHDSYLLIALLMACAKAT